MNLKRTVQESISSLSSILLRCNSTHRSGLRVLLYHSISSGVDFDPHGLFTVDPHSFENQMRILAKNTDVSLVGLSDCLHAISNRSLAVAVTFDDGYKDNFYTVAPIMQKYGIPFTVFVSTALIQNKTPYFLTPNELRELSMLPNVKIGSHGVTHSRLTKLSKNELHAELISSKRCLEDITGNEVMAISYPHGAVNSKVIDAVIRAGYKIGVCSRFDINNAASNPLLLNRTTILAKDTNKVFLQKLNGAWDWYKWIQQ